MYEKMKEKQIMEILKMVNESDYGFLSLVEGDFELTVLKKDMDPELLNSKLLNGDSNTQVYETNAANAPAPEAVQQAPKQEAPSLSAQEAAVAVETKTASAQATKEQSAKNYSENHIMVKAPMLGTFFRKPSPDEDAYVEIGDVVESSDTLCLIEVMKLFNSVSAGQKGRVVDILAEDGELVEYDQPLFVIEPM